MRLTRGVWFLLGFALTLAVIWAGASIWTLLQEQDNGKHLVKIERIVTGLHRAQRAAPAGGDATQPAQAGQPSKPAASPAKQHSHESHHHPSQTGKPAGPSPQPSSPAAAEPSEPGNSGNGASSEHGVDACVNVAVSACVKADVGQP